MPISIDQLHTKVVVRRIAVGAAPFRWEIFGFDPGVPKYVSSCRYRSMEDAYSAGLGRLLGAEGAPAAAQAGNGRPGTFARSQVVDFAARQRREARSLAASRSDSKPARPRASKPRVSGNVRELGEDHIKHCPSNAWLHAFLA